MKAYKFKIRPNKKFIAGCERTLDGCRELYNAALEERRDAKKKAHKSIGFAEQCRELTEVRAIRSDIANIHSQVLQATLKKLQRAFENFFRRVKAGDKPGYPRFKSKDRFNSFTYPQAGFKLTGDKLTLSRVGSSRIRLSREIEGKIKTCTVKKQVDGWFVIFTVENTLPLPLPKTGEAVGIDVGIENFATLSTGEVIENPRFLKESEPELKIAQRKVSKKKKRGKNRRKAATQLAKKHQKVANQRRDFAHKTANQVIREFDDIAVEDLKIKGMVKNHCLAKAICDAAWGLFIMLLIYKAEEAGRRVWKVAPHFTSQDCSRCGERVKKSLAVREHRCIGCGLVLDRDHNAAINIMVRAEPLARADSRLSDPRIPPL